MKQRILLLLFFSFALTNCIIPETALSSRNQKKVIFLTGAAGFIGSHFLKYMFNKYPTYNFIVLDVLTYAGNLENIPDHIKKSDRFTFVYDTVTNQEVVDACMNKADFVVHFAAESHVTRSITNPKIFIDTDVQGTLVMMQSLVKHPNVQRFVHISTSEVYGTAEFEPITEAHPLNPRSPYAAAKLGADRLVWAYCCTYNVPAVIIRPFNNFGTNQHIEKLIPKFITLALNGNNLTVHGSGNAKRDWVHVLDTCDALDKVLHIENFDTIKHQVINIGTGTSTSVLQIAQIILDHLGLPSNRIAFVEDRPGQVDCHNSSTDKAEKLLGWKAQRTLQNSLPEIIDWYQANESWWEKLEIMQWIPIYTNNKLQLQ